MAQKGCYNLQPMDCLLGLDTTLKLAVLLAWVWIQMLIRSKWTDYSGPHLVVVKPRCIYQVVEFLRREQKHYWEKMYGLQS